MFLKVSKSQKQFFLKLLWPKNERNIGQNSILESKMWSNQKYKDILLCLCLCLLRGPVQKVQKVQKDTRFHIFFYKRYLVLIM